MMMKSSSWFPFLVHGLGSNSWYHRSESVPACVNGTRKSTTVLSRKVTAILKWPCKCLKWPCKEKPCLLSIMEFLNVCWSTLSAKCSEEPARQQVNPSYRGATSSNTLNVLSDPVGWFLIWHVDPWTVGNSRSTHKAGVPHSRCVGKLAIPEEGGYVCNPHMLGKGIRARSCVHMCRWP